MPAARRWDEYRVDGTYAAGTEGDGLTNGIHLGRLVYDKGIFAHAPSRVEFDLDGAYQAVSGCAGIAVMADCGVAGAGGSRHENGDVTFSILADGVSVWSQYSDAGDRVCFEVSAADVQQLVLVAATAGSHSCDAAAWTDLKACTSSSNDGAAVHTCGANALASSVGVIHSVCCSTADCASNTPDSCSQGCADEFLPFFEGCMDVMDASMRTAMEPLFAICINRPDVPAAPAASCSYLGSDIPADSAAVGWGE